MSSSTTSAASGSSSTTPPPALTTTFTPASSCTVNFYRYAYIMSDAACYYGSSQVDCAFYHLGQTTSDSACLPSGWSDASSSYYSPGVCPVGYTEACTKVNAGETTATCCPQGYSCQTTTGMPWFLTDVCTSDMASTQRFVYTTSIAGEGWVKSTVSDQQGLNAFGLRIHYHATDFPTTTSSSSSATTTSGSTGTAATATATSSPSSSSSSSGLSAGAKAAVGVGSTIGALAVICALAFLVLRYRRKNKASNNIHHHPDGPGGGPISLGAYVPGPDANGAYAAVPGGALSPTPGYTEYKYGYDTPAPAAAPAAAAAPQYAEVPGDNWNRPVVELSANR